MEIDQKFYYCLLANFTFFGVHMIVPMGRGDQKLEPLYLSMLENSLDTLYNGMQMPTQQPAAQKGSSSEKSSLPLYYLKTRMEGDGKHFWDSAWEALKNAQYIYDQLKSTHTVAYDISQVPYDDQWFPSFANAEKLNASFEELGAVIRTLNLFDGNYAPIEANVSKLSPKFIINKDKIRHIKNKKGSVFVFFINPTTDHWLTIVAYNNDGKINYYSADNISQDAGVYREAVAFLQKLIND